MGGRDWCINALCLLFAFRGIFKQQSLVDGWFQHLFAIHHRTVTSPAQYQGDATIIESKAFFIPYFDQRRYFPLLSETTVTITVAISLASHITVSRQQCKQARGTSLSSSKCKCLTQWVPFLLDTVRKVDLPQLQGHWAKKHVLLKLWAIPDWSMECLWLNGVQRHPVLQHLHEGRIAVPSNHLRLSLCLFWRIWLQVDLKD